MYVHTLSSSNTDLRHRSEHQTCVGTAQTHCATLPVNTQTGSSVSAVWRSDDATNVDTADFREHLALKPHPIRHTIQHSTSYITQSSTLENIQPHAISGDMSRKSEWVHDSTHKVITETNLCRRLTAPTLKGLQLATISWFSYKEETSGTKWHLARQQMWITLNSAEYCATAKSYWKLPFQREANWQVIFIAWHFA